MALPRGVEPQASPRTHESTDRPLVADRPDTTEAAITVPAGRFQLEISLTDWSREVRDDTFIGLQSNVKYGLTDNTDLQVVFDSYALTNNARDEDTEGFGDLAVRYKWNIWGNGDPEGTAFALMPYVKIPTDTDRSNGEWEGGLIAPWSSPLPNGLALGLMGQLDVVFDPVDDHELEFLHTAVLGFDLPGDFGSFWEFVGVVTDDAYVASTNLGVTLARGENLVLDAGVRLGISEEADDLGLFVGFTKRF